MRVILLTPILLALGCMGLTQNPSYFPYYFPTGDVIRTHAKPPGLGYFKNFDPKVCKIELTPANSMNGTKAQVVLVATVVDKDDDARRKRRVEWQLEGPGQIVEVDESGWTAGRGYQITDKFAVSYTDFKEHTITRGNDDAKDDFTICAGQTWCVVSSPVEGQTIVTAYAPEVYDWDKRRAFATLVWSNGGFLPAVRTGRETDSTLLEKAKADAPAGTSLVLDAKLAKAVALNRETTATISLANGGRTASSSATIRAVIPEGVELVRTDPPATRRTGRDLYWTVGTVPGGQSKDISLTLKPTQNGAFTLTAAADTQDGLTAGTKAESMAGSAGMTVAVEPPKFATSGETAKVDIIVTNTGNVPIENAVAWVTPGQGLTTGRETSPLEVRVGSIAAGQSKTVTAPLESTGSGKGTVRVDVTADGGLSARGEGSVTIGKAELMVRIVGPENVPVGDTATYEVQVVNAGDVPASDIAVRSSLPRGMTVSSASDGSTTSDGAAWKLATLAPGEKKVFRLAATGDRLSELGSVTATATGSLTDGRQLATAKTSAPATVRGLPVLTLEMAPLASVSVGGRPSYRLVVRNRGSGPARDVAMTVELSNELRAIKANSKASVTDRRVMFEIAREIAAGATVTYIVDAEALTAGDARVTAELRSKDLSAPLKDEQATRIHSRK